MLGTFPKAFPKRQLSQSVLASKIAPSTLSSCSARPPSPRKKASIAACGASKDLTFGKLLFEKLGKTPLGKYLTQKK